MSSSGGVSGHRCHKWDKLLSSFWFSSGDYVQSGEVSIAHSLSLLNSHHLDMTEILLERC